MVSLQLSAYQYQYNHFPLPASRIRMQNGGSSILKESQCRFSTGTQIPSGFTPILQRQLCVAPIEAILFDIDGTLCDSDPIHYFAFRDMLQEIGFNGGVPITEKFFIENISGKHNDHISPILFPDWDHERGREFLDDKEALFRRMASEKLKPVDGLNKFCKWIAERGLKRAAVTNAPRPNAELILSKMELLEYFDTLVIGTEWGRPKPFPDAYLKALQVLEVSLEHTFVFEDSVSGIKAAKAAGMEVVGVALRNPEKLLSEAGAIFTIKDFNDSRLWTALEEIGKLG